MTTYTFGYGSLMNPESLRSTLPNAPLERIIPARIAGFVRLWDVAFPNDGSQADKAYFDSDNKKPPFILFVNMGLMRVKEREPINGVLVPIDKDDLSILQRREGRYHTIDVTAHVRPYADHKPSEREEDFKVIAFTGRPEFTKPEDVQRAVIPKSYRDSIFEGVSFWNQRCTGFEDDFHRSTVVSSTTEVVDLRRVNT